MSVPQERVNIFDAIHREREYQDFKWGHKFDDKNTANDWLAYIAGYLGKALTRPWDRGTFFTGLVKVAALCVAALETLDRNNGFPKRHYD